MGGRRRLSVIDAVVRIQCIFSKLHEVHGFFLLPRVGGFVRDATGASGSNGG
jgi:hypothetical protein